MLITPTNFMNSSSKRQFRFTVDTSIAGGSGVNHFELPLVSAGTIDFNVDWGDGSDDDITAFNQAELDHDYGAAGTYEITITNNTSNVRGLKFNNGGDRLKLLEVRECAVLEITEIGTFYGCSNMTWTATDVPVISTANLQSTFRSCFLYDANMNNWDFSGVSIFQLFLYEALVYNQPMDNIDTSSMSNAVNMLRSTAFDQDISPWDVTALTTATNFLTGETLSTANYDALLIAWEGQAVQNNVTINFGNSKYTSGGAAETAKTDLTNDHSWTITDGGAA